MVAPFGRAVQDYKVFTWACWEIREAQVHTYSNIYSLLPRAVSVGLRPIRQPPSNPLFDNPLPTQKPGPGDKMAQEGSFFELVLTWVMLVQ